MLFDYSIERRNWIYGGRREFWTTMLIIGMVLLPLRFAMYGSLYGWRSLELASGLISIALVVSFVLWRWTLSRHVHDAQLYRSVVPVWRRFFSATAGAPEGSQLHVLREQLPLKILR